MNETQRPIPAQKHAALSALLVRVLSIVGVVLVGVALVELTSTRWVWSAQQRAPSATIALPYREAAMASYRKPSDATLRQQLTPEQYAVTQQEGTELPFQNPYWANHAPGIYVDVVSGEPLFSSLDKYDSGTGWPSFTQPLVTANIETQTDAALFMPRTEVHSTHAHSHLGHVFTDGPAPIGLRYCMNSAALRFIPVDEMETQGYGAYLPLSRPSPAP